MAWFAADSSAELDTQIENATSESIPNGDIDMAVALEITDAIRSRKVPPKTAMRCLKKRLAKVYANPNLLSSTLKLCDMCVKNGGSAFLEELNSKEFVDYLVDFIFSVHYDTKNRQVQMSEAKHAVGVHILRVVQEWSLYLEHKQNNYLNRVVQNLQRQGYEFPAVDAGVAQNAANFVDSVTPPDWIDGKDCMVCYNPFSVMNRKHHCRACGGVFCQEHSSHTMALPNLGILNSVRVCDDCYQIHGKGERGARDREPREPRGELRDGEDDDEDFKRAVERSLQDSVPTHAPVQDDMDDMDDDMKAAIAASLAESANQSSSLRNHESPDIRGGGEPAKSPYAGHSGESEFYQTALSFDANAYKEPEASVQPGPNGEGYGQNQDSYGQIQESSEQRHSNHGRNHQTVNLDQDLTPQEEDDINLFVQLINGVKNDPSRQANILHDQKLSDLHSRVVRLRPRLNRSLRNSIEKYEFFLEMNNKINTVTRLYDQFLESKLSEAYGRHSLQGYRTEDSGIGHDYTSPQYTGMSQTPTGPSGSSANLHPGGNVANYTGGEPASNYIANVPNYTGSVAPNYTGNIAPNYTGNIAPNFTESIPSNTGNIASNYSGQAPNYSGTVAPSDGANHRGNYANYANHSGSKYSALPPPESSRTGSQYQSQSGQSAPYPLDMQAKPEYVKADNDAAPAHNFQPSSPPGSDVSDTESVASRYPALEDRYEEDTPVHQGHATERYPSMTEIERENEVKKSEPEPLIEL